MSWRDLLAPARQQPKSWTPGESHEADARAQAQKATTPSSPATDAAPMAPRADFSDVRVHADSEAQGLAESFGAKAFTYGHDVFFGPGQFAPNSQAGSELLAHEVAHVGQQGAEGSPALQFDPKGQKAGIGATPPEEDFIKDTETWGSEDAHILFGQDDAAIDADDEAAARKAVADIKEASIVHVQGYASAEGPGDYNLNLSAHRGVQLKRLLEKLLPAGSRIYVFAHGESRHFGAAKENRRGGISVMGTVAEGGYHPTFHFDLGSGPLVPPRGITVPNDTTKEGDGPPPIPPIVLDPTRFGLAQPPYLRPLPPLLTPRHLMNNADLVNPSAMHGVGASATGNIVEMWDAAYWKYRRLGIPDELKLGPIDLGAGELANKEVKNSIQAYHERNDPTVIEKSNQDLDAHVIMSPNLLELFGSKKKKNKK